MTMSRVHTALKVMDFAGRFARELPLALGGRRLQRHKLYQMAAARAGQSGRPLLVIGDPDAGFVNGLLGRDYGCGGICLDLNDCGACPVSLKGRAEDILPQFPDDSHVIFVSCVLEYVEDYDQVHRELFRVAGKAPGNLFIAHVEPDSLAAIFYPGARRIVHSAPPVTPDIIVQELPQHGGEDTFGREEGSQG